MRPLRALRTLAAMLCSLLLCSSVAADEPARVADVPEGSATIMLIGEAAESDELRDLFAELLGRTNVVVRFLREAEFRRQDLLTPSEDDAVHVFVVIAQRRAKLYFRGPEGQRFLLREVALPHGLDEVGRELVGQIVESSVLALLHRTGGITREEAQLELERRAPELAVPDLPPRSEAPAADVPQAEQTRRTWEAWAASRYSATFTGDAGVGHGPGVELGLATRARVLLRSRMVAEHWFSRSIEAGVIAADIATTRARWAFDLGLGLGRRATLVLSLGAGVDWVRVAPNRADAPNWELAPASRRRLPAACGELRLEIGGRAWQLAVGAALDASLADTHYDVQEARRLVRVAEEWQLRPGVVVALGVRPRF